MRKKRLLIAVPIVGTAAVLLGVTVIPPVPIKLVWDYPPAELSTNLGFVVYHSSDITAPMTNWTILTNVSGLSTSVSLTIGLGPHFYAVKATNTWGESPFSNVATCPALPRSDVNLRLINAP